MKFYDYITWESIVSITHLFARYEKYLEREEEFKSRNQSENRLTGKKQHNTEKGSSTSRLTGNRGKKSYKDTSIQTNGRGLNSETQNIIETGKTQRRVIKTETEEERFLCW